MREESELSEKTLKFRERINAVVYFLIGFSILSIMIGIFAGTIWYTLRPDYKVGDCVIDKNLESWNKPDIYKIKEVGHNKYLTTKINTGEDLEYTIGGTDGSTRKVACP